MNKLILEKGLDALVSSYIDNIMGGSNDDIYELLYLTLKQCVSLNLTVVPSSVTVGPSIVMVGRLIEQGAISIASRHKLAISALTPPETAIRAKRLLAFCNYFRDYIQNFSSKTIRLRQFSANINVNKVQLALEIENLKQELLTAIPLRPVPVDANLYGFADYSNLGIGAALLSNTDNDPTIYVSRFISRSLKGIESSYIAIEGKALALLFLLRASQREALVAKKFIIYTDYQPLVGALKNYTLDSNISPRLSRLLSKIIIFSRTLEYLSGTKQTVADLLSRMPVM